MQLSPDSMRVPDGDLSVQQAECQVLLDFLLQGKLPEDADDAKRVAAQATQFDVLDGVLCYVGLKGGSQVR